jgi:hypothetical protein
MPAGRAVEDTVGVLVEVGDQLRSGELFGGEVEGVKVAGRGSAESDGGDSLRSLQAAGRSWTAVSAKDLFEQLGRGPELNVVGLEHRVLVSVADHRNVEVVAAAAASQHRVKLLSGLLTGHHAVHSVGGDTLRGVHGGRVPQLGSDADVVGGERHGAAIPYVPHPQTTGLG